MSTRYLLDTNVISQLVSDPHGRLAGRLLALGEDRLCTSIIVSCELRFGVAKKRSPRLAAQLDAVLNALTVVPFDGEADRHYAEIRVELERKGHPIGSNDLLIAAHARSLGATVLTSNDREFRRVPGLRVERCAPAA